MKNVFHFILKVLFVLKIFKFLPRLFLTKKEKQLIKLRLCVLIMSYTRFRVTLHSEWQVIWILSYCNGIRTHNHLVRKRTLNLVRKRTRNLWRRGAVVISTAQLHSTKLELRFCICSNPGCSVWEIRDGEDLRQWSRLEIRLNAFRWSTIPQKYFSYFSPNFFLFLMVELCCEYLYVGEFDCEVSIFHHFWKAFSCQKLSETQEWAYCYSINDQNDQSGQKFVQV